MRSRRLTSWFGWLSYGVTLLSAAACSSDGAAPVPDGPTIGGDEQSEFVSSVPNDSGGGRNNLGADGATAAGAVPTAAGMANESASPERAIAEADILKVDGNRIYALSAYSGLSIVDVSNPRALRLEGSYRSSAIPFEMYVEDGIVFAMFNSWSSYECDEATNTCSWQNTSRLKALDARNPASIVQLADYVVPGSIADSRRVGDILYLATQEYNGCWGCDVAPNTNLTSFDVSELTALRKVDQLRFPAENDSYIAQRSISVTQDRVYISGWEWRPNTQNVAGSIQVVDISDPQGALVAGANVPIAGQVQSRWQMDEFEGVLRVISQPGGWGASAIPPVLETFRVSSASAVQRLAGLPLVLPRPNETLQSARFDGERAYAITLERRDPLVTFDLSDPASPKQVGVLEMPGWVYHMEPRGDRLFALGFDNEDQQGSLNVSLFDVSNLAAPRLIDRVPFGGDWGSFAEDQDRIHKAFSILDDARLILVPYAGGSYDETTCNYDYGSGIQLVDFTNDSLTRRGVAPQVGNARRALLHDGYLFGIGDNALQTFDITDRDAPVATGQLDVARNVTTVRVLGDHLLRFGNDWWTSQTTLDMTPIARASDPEPQAEIDLSALFGENAWSCNRSSEWTGQVFVKGNYAYVPRYNYTWANGNGSGYEQKLTFYVIDLTDRNAPRAIGSLPMQPTTDGFSFASIIQTDNTLLIGRNKYPQYDYDYTNRKNVLRTPGQYFYDVVDLSNPAAPSVAERFEVPELFAGGGWGYYPFAGCSIDMAWGWYGGGYYGSTALTDGDMVISQHSEPIAGSDTDVRYYMDRIDVSDPRNPVIFPKVNVPGNVVHFNAQTGEIVTVDYQRSVEQGRTYEDCYGLGAYGWFDETIRACRVERRNINSLLLEGDRAVRKSQVALDHDRRVANIAVSDSRIFYTTSEFPVYANVYNGSVPLNTVKLESLRLTNGQLQALPTQELGASPSYYWGDLLARGDRVFEIRESQMTVVDTANPAAPVSKTFDLPGYYCSALEVAGDSAYCALGQRGVEVIDLSTMH